MLKLFQPTSKVQKDRQIIQQTDRRMAKYSRRGIISNFLIYSLCLLFEQRFIAQYKTWVLVLTVGLLFVTVWRGYLLFRIDAIYPRGPTAWRNKYFLATLVGAFWWSLILSSFTLLLDLKGEAALLWLYTVVFFSTTAHAFAPYQRFLSIYQFVGLVPAAVCTFFIGELIGVFYGCILLFFYWVLNHHCELMSQNYWDRLEAHYSLARKTESLEEEKRDTRASVQLSKEYLHVLNRKMQALLAAPEEGVATFGPVAAAGQRAALEHICQNVGDFQRILIKDFGVEERTFNARHYLQSVLRDVLEDAEGRGLELETALSPALPARLIGDSKRVGQVVTTVVNSVLQQQSDGVVMVEVEFMRPYENAGELHVTVARQAGQVKRSFFQAEPDDVLDVNLDLVLAKGIADALGGSLDVEEPGGKNGSRLRFRVPLGIAEVQAQQEYHRQEFKGRRLLLVHRNPRWLDHKRLELDTMGFDVQTAKHHKKALQEINSGLSSGNPFELVVYYSAPGDDASIHFCDELNNNNDLKQTHQFVVCSALGRKFFSERIGTLPPTLHFIDRPAGFFEFDTVFGPLFEVQAPNFSDEGSSERNRPLNVLWVALGKQFDNARIYEGAQVKVRRIGEIKQVAKHLESQLFDLAIVEYSGAEILEGICTIRELEYQQGVGALIPIIGVGPQEVHRNMLAYGADHVVSIEALVGGDDRTLRCWARGAHL